ncbi:MAG: acyl--CoA ligase [Planctomycetia bacterium]|nr:acyl--CoA ligase [Planctomycetia bacterium]
MGEYPAVLGPQTDASVSYRALNEAILATSGRLQALGVRPGNCVGLHYPSSVHYIIGNYAIWHCGACVVPLPVELATEEKRHICRCLALDYVISDKSCSGLLEPFGRTEASDLAALGAEIIPIRGAAHRPAGFHAINSAFIRYTSGTTGASKGVVLSHESIFERICAANEALCIGPEDRVLWVLSMSYHFTVSIVSYLTFGATIVLPANHFAAAIVDAICRHRATLLYASPMHYALLADCAQATRLPSLRLAISTTSSLDGRVAWKFAERYGRPIAQALGIIEVGLPCVHVDSNTERWDSVGRVLPAYQLRLEDAGLGPQLREVLIRGPGFLDAYYHPWQSRREIMPDGWFRTGDVGWLDQNGYLFLRGRSKDVIDVMGMKFFPQEVERVLMSHPHVSAASVVSARDDRWGETVHACVVAKHPRGADLEEELRQYCAGQMAAYKVPRRIEFVRALPCTASGKVLHRAK